MPIEGSPSKIIIITDTNDDDDRRQQRIACDKHTVDLWVYGLNERKKRRI